MVVPWLAAHGDLSRCVLLGVSCGANIAKYVARYSVEAGKLLDPVRVVGQVIMYPFFIGGSPTRSEIKLSNSYQYVRQIYVNSCMETFPARGRVNMDHPAANPLVPAGGVPLKYMPPTLTVVAEHDLMRDRAIAYSEALCERSVWMFLFFITKTPFMNLQTFRYSSHPQSQACTEDIAQEVHISERLLSFHTELTKMAYSYNEL